MTTTFIKNKITITQSLKERGKMNKTYDFYLTYNRGLDAHGRVNQERVNNLSQTLESIAFINTIHDDEMEGENIMTSLNDKCDKVLVFITKRYIDKVTSKYSHEDSCRMEFDYSARRRGIKNLIPIVMEEECKSLKNWKGVLGTTLATQQYIDFSSDENLNQVVREIARRVERLNVEMEWEQGFYTGAIDENNVPHGFGNIEYSQAYSGDKLVFYDGLWNHGFLDGYGCLNTIEGTYTGHFVNDQFHGEGKFVENNGNTYVGTFVHDEKEGKGTYFKSKDNEQVVVYEGEYKKGKMHGPGLSRQDDGMLYEGLFQNGLKHGQGKLTIPGSGNFEGTFINDLFEGFGEYKFENGDYYKGYFKAGKFHGSGKYVFANGAFYDGEYNKGKKHGNGLYKFKNTDESYCGEWNDNEMTGKGIRVYENGDVYIGDMVRGVREGQGEMHFKQKNQTYKGGK